MTINGIIMLTLYIFSAGVLFYWLRKKYADERQVEIYSRDQRTIFPFHMKILALYVVIQLCASIIGAAGAALKDNMFMYALLNALFYGIDTGFVGNYKTMKIKCSSFTASLEPSSWNSGDGSAQWNR